MGSVILSQVRFIYADADVFPDFADIFRESLNECPNVSGINHGHFPLRTHDLGRSCRNGQIAPSVKPPLINLETLVWYLCFYSPRVWQFGTWKSLLQRLKLGK
jgi:hypothetical protein